MKRKKWQPICDLTGTECQFGGAKYFNYGFMRGTEDFCKHPRENRAIYLFDGRSINCPLGLPKKETANADPCA